MQADLIGRVLTSLVEILSCRPVYHHLVEMIGGDDGPDTTSWLESASRPAPQLLISRTKLVVTQYAATTLTQPVLWNTVQWPIVANPLYTFGILGGCLCDHVPWLRCSSWSISRGVKLLIICYLWAEFVEGHRAMDGSRFSSVRPSVEWLRVELLIYESSLIDFLLISFSSLALELPILNVTSAFSPSRVQCVCRSNLNRYISADKSCWLDGKYCTINSRAKRLQRHEFSVSIFVVSTRVTLHLNNLNELTIQRQRCCYSSVLEWNTRFWNRTL